MSKLTIKEVSNVYDLLIPDSFNGLLIIHLNKKINEKEILEEFTQSDIKQAIIEVTQVLPPQPIPQIEKTLKTLFYFFLERPPGNQFNKYILTNYAKRFIRLIEYKLHSPHRNFPLRETFNKYLSFQSNKIKSIENFNEWFELGFNETSKETIAQHLESLQDEVNESINKLKTILQSKEKEALLMVKEFVNVFILLGEKAKQLADALDLKNEILIEAKKVTDFFYKKITNARHYVDEKEKEIFLNLEKDWHFSVNIYRDVKSFFLQIDGRLELIRSQILFASSKLTELQENFKAQSLYKLKLKKLLEIVLKNSYYNKEELRLLQNFPLKEIPFEKFKFIAIPYYDFAVFKIQEIEKRELDEQYHLQELNKIEQELNRQEKTEKWFNYLKKELQNLSEINFEYYFFRILEEEKDVEIPIQVGFELIQYANKNQDYILDISKVINEDDKFKGFYVWKIRIRKTKTNFLF